MTVTAVIVGYNHWGDYTFPLLQSAKRTNPELRLVCVDNASAEPYPEMAGVKMLRSDNQLGLAGGLNLGINSVESDWYMCLNQDVLIHKPIVERICKLDPRTVYGFFMKRKDADGFPWEWLSNWCLFLSRIAWETIGEWDENCYPIYWEDADYCKRALDTGFDLRSLDRKSWGIEHLMVESKKRYRVHYAIDNAEAIETLRQYVRTKHGY